MATRNNLINDIAKLAADVAKRDLQSNADDNNPEILSLISAVTEQIKQRSGNSQQLNDLVSMIEASLPAIVTKPPTDNALIDILPRP
jgi:DNA repair ATPase RecN